jgi:hypothetical protein
MLVRMPQIESNLISIYNSIEYPREAYENSITGIVIAKVHVNYDILEVWCDIVKSAHPLFNDPIKIAIQNNSLSILKSLKNTEEEIIYLPFDFNITATSFTEDLKKNEVIKIHKDYKYNRF